MSLLRPLVRILVRRGIPFGFFADLAKRVYVDLASSDEFGIPVQYVGVGEKVEDLQHFSADDFVDALFESGEPD